MALVLSMRLGQDFYVGDTRVVVSKIISAAEFVLRVNDHRVKVDDAGWVSLMPSVRVMAGTPRSQTQSNIVVVLVEAPRSILVLRGSLYHRSKGKFKRCETCAGVGYLKTKVMCDDCRGLGCGRCDGIGMKFVDFKCPDCGEVGNETE